MTIYPLYEDCGELIGIFTSPEKAISAIEKRENCIMNTKPIPEYSDDCIEIYNDSKGIHYYLYKEQMDIIFPTA